MVVLKLVRSVDDESIAIFRALLERSLRGEIRGAALCFELADGQEKTVFTGCYRNNRAAAASAAMSISWELTRMRERKRGPP